MSSFGVWLRCQRGSRASQLIRPLLLQRGRQLVGSFLSDSSIVSKSNNVVEVSGPTAGAGSTTKKKRNPNCKVAESKAWRSGVAGRHQSATPPAATEGAEKTMQGLAVVSPVSLGQSLPIAKPMKPSFSMKGMRRRR